MIVAVIQANCGCKGRSMPLGFKRTERSSYEQPRKSMRRLSDRGGQVGRLHSDDRRPAFDEALEEHDFEEALSMLDQSIPDGVACPSQIFILTDTDTGDGDMEEGIPMPISTKTICMRGGRSRTWSASGRRLERPQTIHSLDHLGMRRDEETKNQKVRKRITTCGEQREVRHTKSEHGKSPSF